MSPVPCRACRMPIEFIPGPNGKPIPVQKVRSVYVKQDGVLIKLGLADVPPYYISHFETCSDPQRFSRSRKEVF